MPIAVSASLKREASFVKIEGLPSLTEHFKKQMSKHCLDMGLCPIAPPKGFPVALWKPSGKNT